MRRVLTIGFFFGFLAVTLFGCGGEVKNPNDPLSGFKPNKAELGEDWPQFVHDASFNCWVFPDGKPRPAEYKTRNLARAFYDGEVSQEELDLIDEGLSSMLTACRQDTNRWQPSNLWTKFVYFQKPSDFKIIFVQSNYTLQEGEAAGCAGMVTGPHGVFTAAGTVCGMNDRVNSSRPGSQGGAYIVIPKQSAEQLARTECKTLMKNAVRHEAEHLFLSNDTNLYFAHANDGVNGNHPYCRGMVSGEGN